MDKMKDVALLAGRVLLALMFVVAGWGKIGGYAGTQGYMEAMGVPGFMLPLVILLELGGGLAIVLGLFTRSLSVLLAGFTLMAAFVFRLDIYWMGKAQIFRFPFGPVMRWLGGIAVQREKSSNLVAASAEAIKAAVRLGLEDHLRGIDTGDESR